MHKNKHFLLLILFFSQYFIAQNIKTIQLRPKNSDAFSPIVQLGTVLKLSFDDLEADNKEYQYKIEHMTHNWQPSDLLPSQYIKGYETDYINDVSNSFNTLQSYTHYSVTIPNSNTSITKSGNYLISVLDENDDIVFSRRCVFFENKTTVGVSALRSRDLKTIDTHQTVQFLVNYSGININNPNQEINVVLLQNNNWNTAITDLEPQFYKRNQLVYNYTKKSNFLGGNEFLSFETKNIRNTNINIANVERKDVFHSYIFTDKSRANNYRYNPDINGSFVVRTLESDDDNSEADYSTVHFNLKTDIPKTKDDVYVYGDFNNFEFTEDNKMTYNKNTNSYQLAIPLKQGFYNYNYAITNTSGIDYTAIDGSFFETENQYTVIVYYRRFGDVYDSVIGVGNGFFNQKN